MRRVKPGAAKRSGSGGARFEVNATVTFIGNGLAEVLVNGKTFTTDIATSEVVPH